jgi:hypothetical protein
VEEPLSYLLEVGGSEMVVTLVDSLAVAVGSLAAAGLLAAAGSLAAAAVAVLPLVVAFAG